jgi:hypothetical protein
VSDDALIRALREADLEELLPQLLEAAKMILRRRRWSAGADYQPSAMEAQELVNETITRIFEEDQNPAFDGDVQKAVVGAMTSVASSAAKKLKKFSLSGGPEDVATEQDKQDAANENGDGAVLEAVWSLVSAANDPELVEYVLAVEYHGPKREIIAEVLNWKPDKVSVVLKRLKRLIARNDLPILKRAAE